MATDVRTMNLSDNGDGMVYLNNNQGTSFVPNIPILWAKSNYSNHQ